MVAMIMSLFFKFIELIPSSCVTGLDCEGVHQLVYNSIMTCDVDTRTHFYCNVVLSGGNTMYPGEKLIHVGYIKSVVLYDQ